MKIKKLTGEAHPALQAKLANLRSPPEKPYTYFVSLDLSEAYHCLDIHEDSRDKTAVSTPEGLFRFKKLPFGLSQAPMHFHSIVQLIERGLAERDADLARSILMYFDDCIIGAHNFEDFVGIYFSAKSCPLQLSVVLVYYCVVVFSQFWYLQP